MKSLISVAVAVIFLTGCLGENGTRTPTGNPVMVPPAGSQCENGNPPPCD